MRSLKFTSSAGSVARMPTPNDILTHIGFDLSSLPPDEYDAEIMFSVWEDVAKHHGFQLPMTATQWIAALERRIRVRRSDIEAINSWADDRPDEAAEMLSEVRREIRVTEARLQQFRIQLGSAN